HHRPSDPGRRNGRRLGRLRVVRRPQRLHGRSHRHRRRLPRHLQRPLDRSELHPAHGEAGKAGHDRPVELLRPEPAHTATETALGLFDSGPKRIVSYYSAQTFSAAGSYTYRDSLHPSLTGLVKVPVTVAPANG